MAKRGYNTRSTASKRRRVSSRRRRGRYAGRYSGYRRMSGPSRRPEAIWRHLKVYNNAFSNAHEAPKIPDGKSVTSLGLSNAAVYEYTVTQPITNIVLFPGLETAAYVHSIRNDGTNEYFVMHLNDKDVFDVQNPANINNFDVLQNPDRSIHKWRRVSQGIHISLQNNAEENDGWWEACRVSMPSSARRWTLAKTAATADNPLLLFPYQIKDILPAEMNRLPSYSTGDLRDIKYTQFNLRPEGNEHDFINLRNFYKMEPTTTDIASSVSRLGVSNTNGLNYDIVANPTNDDALQHDMIEHFNDFGWDAIVIRVHGRVVQTGNVGRNSALKITIRQNDELIYDERSISSRFQTKSPAQKNFTVAKGGTSAASKVKTS